MASEDTVWSFGYGSNMDVVSLQNKKHVVVVDHVPAVLKGWRLSFSLKAFLRSEPAYANIRKGAETDEVHGVAFCMTKTSSEELDRTEAGYNKEQVELYGYDGRVLGGFVYVNKPGIDTTEEVPPSSRYLGVLVKGGRRAGLKDDYLQKLANTPVYKPSQETLDIRKNLPKPDDLPQLTVEELSKHSKSGIDAGFKPRVGVLGYIIEIERSAFGSHLGRDITTRMLNQFYAIPMDDNDDKGRPPYPILSDLDPAAKEYVSTWMDQYIYMSKNVNVVGYLKEFNEQQKSGKSTWKLPQIPE